MTQAIVNEKEAAAYLGISVKTIQGRRFRHEEPRYIKMGKSVRYRLADLDEFLTARTVDPSKAA